MTYSFQFRDVFAAWEFLLDGLVLTLELSLVTMVVGLVIGVAGAAARVYGADLALARRSRVYVEAIRNTPLLVQLFLIFFGLPSAGIKLDANTAALIALSINLGAYTPRSSAPGCEAIPQAQIEAGQSLGLSGLQIFRYVVLFPALKAMYPGARQPVRAADAGDQRRVADLGAGPVPRRLDHPVAHLPRLRGLYRDRRRSISR